MGCKNSPAKTKRHITENSDGYVPFAVYLSLLLLNYFLIQNPYGVYFLTKKHQHT
jgi:hypothetical protein